MNQRNSTNLFGEKHRLNILVPYMLTFRLISSAYFNTSDLRDIPVETLGITLSSMALFLELAAYSGQEEEHLKAITEFGDLIADEIEKRG